MLSNAYFLAKFRFDTAENEPAKNLQNFRKMHFRKMHFRKMHFRKMHFTGGRGEPRAAWRGARRGAEERTRGRVPSKKLREKNGKFIQAESLLHEKSPQMIGCLEVPPKCNEIKTFEDSI